MDAAERRAGHVVVRIPHAKTYPGLRKQGEIDVGHAPRGLKFVGRVQCRNRRSGGRGIQGIRQQVVVREILIATETTLKVVPLVFVCPKPQGIVGITSPSKAVEVKIVEQQALVVQRLHGKRLVEKPRAGLLIYQCVVHIATAGHVVGPVAEFNRRVHQVTAAGNAFWLLGRVLASAGRLRRQHSG